VAEIRDEFSEAKKLKTLGAAWRLATEAQEKVMEPLA